MDLLPIDIILEIFQYLDGNDSLQLLSSSKNLRSLKEKVIITDLIHLKKENYDEIISKKNYDNSGNIKIDYLPEKFPKKISKLVLSESYIHWLYKFCDKNLNILPGNISLPDGITCLSVENMIHCLITIFPIIPNTVKHLILSYYFHPNGYQIKKMINEKYIPESVTHLTLDYTKHICYTLYDRFKEFIPPSVTNITFGDSFDEDITNKIPKHITHLTFGWNFNQNIRGNIPNGVTHLIFGGKFNREIRDAIPNSVTHLTFGSRFNKSIRKAIPGNVTYLKFGYHFNQEIKGHIPANVKILIFGYHFKQDILGAIPDGVVHLKLHNEYPFKESIPERFRK